MITGRSRGLEPVAGRWRLVEGRFGFPCASPSPICYLWHPTGEVFRRSLRFLGNGSEALGGRTASRRWAVS